MDRNIEIGRGTDITEGIISDCRACGKGSMITERRNGRITNSICTNILCDLHPVSFTVEQIQIVMREWMVLEELLIGENEGHIESLAQFLFENLKL